jgi:predicted nucleic acid-binding protein
MPPILIDTNLLVYLYDYRDPAKQSRSAQVLNELGVSGSGRLSVQSLAEFLSIAIRKLAPPLPAADAIRQVESFIRLWPVFDLTPLIVLEAGRGVRDHHLSYYDAQIWASARLNQIPLVFSEDFADGWMLEGVRFVNPFAEGFVLGDWT